MRASWVCVHPTFYEGNPSRTWLHELDDALGWSAFNTLLFGRFYDSGGPASLRSIAAQSYTHTHTHSEINHTEFSGIYSQMGVFRSTSLLLMTSKI